MEWQKNIFRLHTFFSTSGSSLPGITLPRPSWVKLNCLRTDVELFHSTTAEEQSADHILVSCPLHHPPDGAPSLVPLDNDTVDWLKKTTLSI